VGIGESHAHRGQSIEIRSFSLRVAAEVSDPVIQVIDSNKQYIHSFLAKGCGRRTEQHHE